MIRTQVQLTEDQMDRLRRLAAARRVSVAALIREAVDRQLDDEDAFARRSRMIDTLRAAHHRSGFSDISERHDDYLAKDFM